MDKKIFFYAIAILLVIGLLVMTFFPNMIYAFRDSGNSAEDKCNPPDGQTLEAWTEHMSHHPDIYKGCL
ncbi:hypothetical protein AUJ84_01115 [Candidatus Pacearchaeota archaeon CG1_02_32_132]|nr:MAG: hypothetical protein AUJ84_01115 [Candidatus Pacearchaeota archaeon CG1_02_32_132]